MGQQEKIRQRVLFVNKFGPVSNAITGQTANELASYLHENGCEVSFLCIGAVYRANKKDEAPPVAYTTKFIRDFYSGDSSAIRLFMSFVDGFRLLLQASRMKSDVLVIMTEPPLLFFWFQLARRFIKRKVFYFTMDVYPDAFAAGNFISPRNLFYRFFKSVVYKRKPDLLIALGNEQRRFLEERFAGPVPCAVIPCGVVQRDFTETVSTIERDPGKILFGYAGNIGAAHDPAFLVELIRQLDPQQHEIILSLYGTKATQVKEAIADNKAIRYKAFLNHDDIASIDINIASLLPEWNHISVPSKAVTAVCCGSTLLLNAPKTADAWQMFDKACWIIEPGTDYKSDIRRFLDAEFSATVIAEKRNYARQLAAGCVKDRQQAYEKVLSVIQQG